MTTSSSPEGWLDRYGDALFQYALARVRDPSLAEDLVQETLLAGIKAHSSFSQRSSEKTWLISILKHKIIDYFRKSSRESTLNDVSDIAADPTDQYFDSKGMWQADISHWHAPEKSLEREHFWRVLNDCVSGLPDRQAKIFFLREVEGMSTEEICKVMDVTTTNNLWVIMSRIRMRLRQCLETNWFENQPKA